MIGKILYDIILSYLDCFFFTLIGLKIFDTCGNKALLASRTIALASDYNLINLQSDNEAFEVDKKAYSDDEMFCQNQPEGIIKAKNNVE